MFIAVLLWASLGAPAPLPACSKREKTLAGTDAGAPSGKDRSEMMIESNANSRPHLAQLKISIIIPAFNEERLLGETLDHVKTARAAFIALGWESELIVCDNNSTDRTADIARAAGAAVVFEPVNQIARARNRGAEAATND